MSDSYSYSARVKRIVDGDTVYMDVDLGFNVWATIEFRLNGINTPEIVGAQKASGLLAKAELARLLGLGPNRVVSFKSEKYGRWLATIFVKVADGSEINVNDELVKGGFAKPYNGEGAKPAF